MRDLKYKNTSFSLIQRFLLERFIELMDNRSLDSYRVKLSNPNIILSELYSVLNDWTKNKVKSHLTFNACKEELERFLTGDNTLKYNTFSKEVFEDLLAEIKIYDDKSKDSKQNIALLRKLQYSLYTIITENKNYLNSLLDALENEIYKNPTNPGDIIILCLKLDKLIGFLGSELINKGYSKSYLVKFVLSIFVYKPKTNFKECWDEFKRVINSNKKTPFKIVFKINGSLQQLTRISLGELKDEILPIDIARSPNEKSIGFIKSNNNTKFVVIQVEAFDYYQALKNAKSQLASILDKVHLGYSNLKISLRDTALVINTEKPEKANTQKIDFQIDGYYKSDQTKYNDLLDKLNIINKAEFIDIGVKEKIEAAIRYLRLGNESIELEQKFISYWIGLEYIFSTYDKDANTFSRLKYYFTICHLVPYIKRNIYQLHQDIKTLNLDTKITGFNENLEYLKNEITYNELFALVNDYPLIGIRANRIKSVLFGNSENRKRYLKSHQINLEQHLVRIYRFRNELIHDAALIMNIENVTGNLRYYLTFILNRLISYFSTCNPKPSKEKKVKFDDFFLNKESIWYNVKKSRYDKDMLLDVPYNIELLS